MNPLIRSAPSCLALLSLTASLHAQTLSGTALNIGPTSGTDVNTVDTNLLTGVIGKKNFANPGGHKGEMGLMVGKDNFLFSPFSVVAGEGNVADINSSHNYLFGYSNDSCGSFCFAGGKNNGVERAAATAFGEYNDVCSSYGAAIGYGNKIGTYVSGNNGQFVDNGLAFGHYNYINRVQNGDGSTNGAMSSTSYAMGYYNVHNRHYSASFGLGNLVVNRGSVVVGVGGGAPDAFDQTGDAGVTGPKNPVFIIGSGDIAQNPVFRRNAMVVRRDNTVDFSSSQVFLNGSKVVTEASLPNVTSSQLKVGPSNGVVTIAPQNSGFGNVTTMLSGPAGEKHVLAVRSGEDFLESRIELRQGAAPAAVVMTSTGILSGITKINGLSPAGTSNDGSFATLGSSVAASGATSLGYSTASDDYSIAGGNSHATGEVATAFGQGTASGYQSVAIGGGEATATGSVAIGNGTKATMDGQVSLGRYNVTPDEDDLLVVGNGTDDSAAERSTALTLKNDGTLKVAKVIITEAEGAIPNGPFARF